MPFYYYLFLTDFERVLSVPLKGKANYQSKQYFLFMIYVLIKSILGFPAKLGEWQLVDPSSSMGTAGYKPGNAYVSL